MEKAYMGLLDHWVFNEAGDLIVMLTDTLDRAPFTAIFRDPDYEVCMAQRKWQQGDLFLFTGIHLHTAGTLLDPIPCYLVTATQHVPTMA